MKNITKENNILEGMIYAISGPTVIASKMEGVRMNSTCMVGEDGLMAEVILIDGEYVTLQVFEDTTGLSLGEKVVSSNRELMVRLGPGLLSNVFDGIQRPLAQIKEVEGDFIEKGSYIDAIDLKKSWDFKAIKKIGDTVSQGDVLGLIDETRAISHKIMVPPGKSGKIKKIKSGQLTGEDNVCTLESGEEIGLYQDWPVRKGRPYGGKHPSATPFITGQRVFDTVLPITEGGVAVVPGGFGTGKTVIDHTIAKSSLSDIVILIGCGERGNEMTEVLTDFPKLTDPVSGLPLSDRTVLIVNTSNMPVAAREASIFTGITIAEYYRDMGYSVVLLADSISRWAEALREISSRLEEIPGEEGYPPYLSTRLGEFYERAGKVVCHGDGDRSGSVTVISSVSPPGGDFSEPVTQTSLMFSGAFWALDKDLAHRRHFPAVNWNKSFTLYYDQLRQWYEEEVSAEMEPLRQRLLTVLEKEAELTEVAQVIGLESLQDLDRLTLEFSLLVREGFLRQNVFDLNDSFSTFEKQLWILKVIFGLFDRAGEALTRGVYLEKILDTPMKKEVLLLSQVPNKGFKEKAETFLKDMTGIFNSM